MYNERITNCAVRIAEALSMRKTRSIDICNLTGIPKSSMSLYLKGAYEPKQDRITLLAEALDVSETWLRGYDVPMERVAPHPKVDALTEEESALVEAFRKLSDSKRKLAVDMVKMLLEERTSYALER